MPVDVSTRVPKTGRGSRRKLGHRRPVSRRSGPSFGGKLESFGHRSKGGKAGVATRSHQPRLREAAGQPRQGSGVNPYKSNTPASAPPYDAAEVSVQGYALDMDSAFSSPVRDSSSSSTRSLYLPYMVRPDLQAILSLSSRRRSRGLRRYRIVCLYSRLVSGHNALSEGVLTTVPRSHPSTPLQGTVGAATSQAIAGVLSKIRKLHDCLYGAAVNNSIPRLVVQLCSSGAAPIDGANSASPPDLAPLSDESRDGGGGDRKQGSDQTDVQCCRTHQSLTNLRLGLRFPGGGGLTL